MISPTGFDQDGNPSPWNTLPQELLVSIFPHLVDPNTLNLNQLLSLRLISRAANDEVTTVATAIIRVPNSQELPSDLERYGKNAAVYAGSSSVNLLNCFIYKSDCARVFEAVEDYHMEADVKQSLEKLKSFQYPCLRFKTNSVHLLTEYRLYLAALQKSFKPRLLDIELDAVEGLFEIEEEEKDKKASIAYYDQLEPLLTDDLQEFSITMDPDLFRALIDPEGAIDFEEEGLEPDTRTLERIFFGKKLDQLTALKIKLYSSNHFVDDDEKVRRFRNVDVISLETLTPNVRDLSLRHCFLEKGFVMRLVASPLLDQIERLNFYESLFEDRACLAQLFGSPKLANLREFALPYFDESVDQNLEAATRKLEENSNLGNLRALTVSDQELPKRTVAVLMRVLKYNTSLVNLETLDGFQINRGESFFLKVFWQAQGMRTSKEKF